MVTGNEDQGRKFITTEPIAETQANEHKVWDAVKNAFSERDCIGYWRYPIFATVGDIHKEPDILIADKSLSLIVIDIIPVTVEQIIKIQENLWQLQNFKIKEFAPYQQAEQQLKAFSATCDRESDLWRKVTGRALIALPLITEEQWQQKGWDENFSSEPIIFQEHLSKASLLERIEQAPITVPGEVLNEQQWRKLLTVLGGMPVLRKASRSSVSSQGKSRSTVLSLLQERLHELDLQQEHIGKEIPPGFQRLRGVAGSGKTMLLCQKAANMHLKHPDWDIALVFFTRTLYEMMTGLVDRWLRWLSQGEVSYNAGTSRLRILHAWGAKDQAGFYRMICEFNGMRPKGAGESQEKQPSRALADLCKRLLEETKIEPLFDAILIDEGQDLVSEDDLKFQEKQAIYWLAYQALRPVDLEHPEQRRLIWAYDEAQSLESLKIPTAKELFGEEIGGIFSKGVHYSGGIKKSEIMRRCYRTPGSIITAAHAIGMGLFRVDGMLTGITRAEDWRSIGYEVTGKFIPGQKITLHRPAENSPNPVEELWEDSVIELNTYSCRQEELQALADKIMHNLVEDELKPSRDILVIILGAGADAIHLENKVAGFLIEQNIDIYIPTALELNELNPQWPNRNPDRFWKEGGVTVSRVTRAKGNEADMVYVVGLDYVAQDDSNVNLRNQLFIALTRARGWVNISGVGNYPLYEELQEVIDSGDTFTFVYRRPLKREISEEEMG
jgi:superfamily I DNA and RNA helicase